MRARGAGPRVAIREGESVRLPRSDDDAELGAALASPSLNALIELGPDAWRAARGCDGDVVPLASCEPLLPVAIRDYVDFYASEEHASNFARIFRPGAPLLADNWKHLPVAYHGRASTVVVSGTPVRRPRGQVAPSELAPTRALDFECEVGFVCGPSADGPVGVDDFERHVFGAVLVNDWSARDIQRLEMPPLGPFLGKSFATSMSAWVVPLDDLRPARVAPRAQDPSPASYLRASDPWALDIALEIELNGEVISRPNASWLYWTPAQMLAHMTVNGARLSAGDLFATGTVSGWDTGTEGSLGEFARGERWLADGDEVVLRGRAAGGLELAEVRGRITPTG